MTKLYLKDLSGYERLPDLSNGETLRTDHQGCGDKCATVLRTPVGWVAHCFKCGGKGFEHSRVAAIRKEPEVTKAASGPILAAMNEIDPSIPAHATALRQLGMLGWIDKISLARLRIGDGRIHFPLHSIYRNEEHIHYADSGWAGKLIQSAGGSVPKWRIVTVPSVVESTTVFRHAISPIVETIVVVEDAISALKIGQLVPNTMGIAMLGLSIGPLLLEYLCALPNGVLVVVWPDGDSKGVERGTALFKQLQFLRPENTEFNVAPGLDPKHLPPDFLRSEIARLRKKASPRT